MHGPPDAAPVLALALAIDAAVGDPPALYRRVPHPVAAMGALLGALERRWNRPEAGERRRRRLGALALAAVVGAAALGGWLVQEAARAAPWGLGFALEALAASVLLAQNGLHRHVAAVAAAFETGGIAAARAAVAHIVGRDPESLDEAGTSRAAIESLAENFSDGVVAPAFWFLLLGLPGLAAYKAINTADSMVGHRDERHRAFGRAAARLDDAANWAPARLSALAIAAAALALPGASAGEAWRAARRDAGRHRSPNAGWPEAAMAGALGLRLAGPRRYGGRAVADSWMGDGRANAGPADIRRALALHIRACAALWLAVLALWAL